MRRTVGSRWRAAMVAVALAAIVGVPARAAAIPEPFVRFDLAIGNASFAGTSTPNLVFQVVVTGKDGTVRDRETIKADSDGWWMSSVGVRGNIVGGDRFRARVGSSVVGSLRVPNLTVRGDRVADVVSGRAPAGSTVAVSLLLCPTGLASSALCNVTVYTDRPVNDRGRWTWLADSKPNGGDYIRAIWSSGGHTVLVPGRFPFLDVSVGSARLEGALASGRRSTVSLERSDRTVARARAEGYGAYGYIWTRFRNAARRTVAVAAGDVVRGTFASDAELTVSTVSISITGGLSTASGVCLPGGTASLAWRLGEAVGYQALSVRIDGTWDADLIVTPPAGASYLLACATPAGDVVHLAGTVPAAP